MSGVPPFSTRTRADTLASEEHFDGKTTEYCLAQRAAEKTSRPVRKRAKHKITAATRKLYRLQGKYMSALRPLTKEARAGIKAIREKSGINAAIAAAKRMAE